jgi:hypothetical protein
MFSWNIAFAYQMTMDNACDIMIWFGSWTRFDIDDQAWCIDIAGLRQMGFITDPGGVAFGTPSCFRIVG